ncbi:MAG: hypothetical protein EBZ67_07275 [Chitinophagia bacterium]|nr:hypothetical protein [Chitinophagia bacterium]
MQTRFTDLRFIIGLFFALMAVIVLAGYLTGAGAKLNLWSGLAFAVFGVFMMVSSKAEEEGGEGESNA